jgi:polyhydroxybutyrate depolymerase
MKILMTIICLFFTAAVSADRIDFGRGDVPVTVPENYSDGNPAPLVILLHGYGSNGPQQDFYLGLSKISDRYGFLLVAPTGTLEDRGEGSARRPRTFWYTTGACCDFFNTQIDDNAYIVGIIESMKSNYNVDDRKVFLVGHSNGGFLSYQVAYKNPGLVAAIASLAGASHFETRLAPEDTVHVLQIHGTLDSTIKYEGGDIGGVNYPGAMESVIQWAKYNGCLIEPDEDEARDLDSSLEGYETIVSTFSAGCRSGGSSELWTIADGSHIPRVSESFGSQVIDWLYAHSMP